MNADEVIDLLAVIAAGDKRTVGEADVVVWLEVAEDDSWTLPRARRALREHRRSNAAMVTPAHLAAIIAARRRTARTKVADVAPPRHLADDIHGEIAWRRARTDAWIEHALDAWADTGVVPDDTGLQEQLTEQPRRPALEGRVANLANRFRIPARQERARGDFDELAKEEAT